MLEPEHQIEALVAGWIHARCRQQRMGEPEPLGEGDGEEELQQHGADVRRNRDADERSGRRGLVEQRAGAQRREDADAETDDDPTIVASPPSTMVLAIAALELGHTGRLPLIERPQLNVTKCPSQWKYCDDDVAGEPVGHLVLLDLAPGWLAG